MRNPEPILETQLVAATQAAEPALAAGFSVGRVLSRTASVWWKHLLPFTAMSVVVYAPFAAIFAVFFGMASPLRAPASPFPEEDFRKLFVAFGLVWAFTIVAAVIQAGAVTFGTVRHLSGERARFLEMLRAGFRRGLPVVAVGFVLWIAVVLGMLLLFVPGLLMLVASSVAIPAAVVERPGVIGAIKRSFALTRGCRGALFAAGFVIVVALWV
ncbi:MAG TPA: hypothetical protein VIW03_09525, partial [Anaeromyxobacter sp.]